jgi:hypothetical protein
MINTAGIKKLRAGAIALAAGLALSAATIAQAHGGGGHGGGAYGGGGGHGGRGGYGARRGGYGYGRFGYGGYYGGFGLLEYGLFFDALPLYYSTYWWGGSPYYYANDNFPRKPGRDDPGTRERRLIRVSQERPDQRTAGDRSHRVPALGDGPKWDRILTFG